MKHRRILWESCVLILCLCGGYILQGGRVSYQSRNPGVDVVPAKKPAVSFARLPLSFEANQGQTDARVNYISRGPGYTLFLARGEVTLELTGSKPGIRNSKFDLRDSKLQSATALLRPLIPNPESPVRVYQPRMPTSQEGASAVLRMRLVGANPVAKGKGEQELPGKSNYFIGNDPHKWRTNVPTYAKVKYQSVYPGIDLVFYGNQRQLEHDFVVAPARDASTIALRLEGSRNVFLDAEGDLVIAVDAGEVRLQRPLIYQDGSGGRREIPGGYVLKGAREVAFKVGAYDHNRPLVIDPVLAYSTYLGGSSSDYGVSIAVDSLRNAYVTGATQSPNFPTTLGAFQTSLAGHDNAFVTKLNPSGTGVVYSTYLGGSSNDSGSAIAVDSSGNAHVTGGTGSTDFPTTVGAFQTSLAGTYNAFVTTLYPSGSALVYSTYLGGSSNDSGSGIAVDFSGNAYVTGGTGSTDFPTTVGAFQTSLAGYNNAFVTKLNPSGTGVVYSTYLGGSGGDGGVGIAVDTMSNAYVAGYASSSTFPTTPGAFQTSLAGSESAFVAKLNPTGTGLVYSTYLGSMGTNISNDFFSFGIAIDSSRNAYVTGTTFSGNFPTTAGAFQTSLAGYNNAFVTKLNPSGTGVVYSTYLGGSSSDYGVSIAVDGLRNAYVAGDTDSSNFPTTAGAFQTSPPVGAAFTTSAFVSKLNPTGSALIYSTYLDGGCNSCFIAGNGASGIAVDSSGHAYVTGSTNSSNFPTTAGAFQTSLAGTYNAFVAKLAVPALPCTFTISPAFADLEDTGRNFDVSVRTQSDCSWTAVSDANWVTVESGSPGSGDGVVVLNAAPNTGSSRSGTVTIGSQTLSVTQSAGACGALDVTFEMIVRPGFPEYIYPSTYDYSETISVANGSGTVMPGPIYLVLVGMPNHEPYPNGNGLVGSQLLTTCFSKQGDYLLPVAETMQRNQIVELPLLFFTQSLGGSLRYTTKVLSGTPTH